MSFCSHFDPIRSCHSKTRHSTEAHAALALTKTIKETEDPTLVYYACGHCGGFHIGHPKRNVRNRLRAEHLLKLIDRANGGAK